MLISLNWIRDFVDLPGDLDPRALAERFTRTTAEVDGVHEIRIGAKGLTVARVERVADLPGTQNLHHVTLNLGKAGQAEAVSKAPGLKVGSQVVYAPAGASLASLGTIGVTEVAGKKSSGLIVPAEAIGIAMSAQEAVFVGDSMQPGELLPTELFDDWVIEVDNKSITHRPDLWGHYGIAREIAAILQRAADFSPRGLTAAENSARTEVRGSLLKPFAVAPMEELQPGGLPEIPISIADPKACRRYSGLMLTGVPTQPGPFWMQLRLAHVGLRPISALVDLTNYIMADLGQPMHAFDAGKVDRIEVAWAREGDRFRTLDGVERTLSSATLMIQCGGRNIGIAGIMGGHDTEVTPATTSLLLESANFAPPTIRKAAVALGLRTDASARFEKSQDPSNTTVAIQRFIHLARPIYPAMKLMGRLSDAYPQPFGKISVPVRLARVARTVGRDVPLQEMKGILAPLGFNVAEGAEPKSVAVGVPSFRATGDISIEADVIEEVARCIGYGTIAPSLPLVSVRRFEPNALHELEQRSLEYLTSVPGFHEIHGYIWYDGVWMKQLGAEPGTCVELRNPAAEGCHQLRRTLLPGLLASVVKNRFHFAALSIVELGSVFEVQRAPHLQSERPDSSGRPVGRMNATGLKELCNVGRALPAALGPDGEYRHLGLVVARRGKRLDEATYDSLKTAIENWAWHRFHRSTTFARAAADAHRPWEHPHRTASILVDKQCIGRLSVVDVSLRRAMDEHLASWSVAWAEIRLNGIESLPPRTERLGTIPNFPQVEMDFSLLVPRSAPFAAVVDRLTDFKHDLLKAVRYVGAYEGERIDAARRSLTFRAVLGDDARTLSDADSSDFRQRFEDHIRCCGYALRQ